VGVCLAVTFMLCCLPT